jgi:hypothetical protein
MIANMIVNPPIDPQQALLWQALKHCHLAYAAGSLNFDEYQTLKKCILNVGVRSHTG